MDRHLERMLAGAGQLRSAAKPVLEINPGHDLVTALAALPEGAAMREDAARLLLDEARILDGENPSDVRGFADRLARILTRAAR
jgi:molecular chaperone HtpG